VHNGFKSKSTHHGSFFNDLDVNSKILDLFEMQMSAKYRVKGKMIFIKETVISFPTAPIPIATPTKVRPKN
jgi:hypothetical protein